MFLLSSDVQVFDLDWSSHNFDPAVTIGYPTFVVGIYFRQRQDNMQ
jgi:hypothetical protein